MHSKRIVLMQVFILLEPQELYYHHKQILDKYRYYLLLFGYKVFDVK